MQRIAFDQEPRGDLLNPPLMREAQGGSTTATRWGNVERIQVVIR
jgi:hypothetical protein